MLFTDAASIRDVVLFPLLKPQVESSGEPAGASLGDDEEVTQPGGPA